MLSKKRLEKRIILSAVVFLGIFSAGLSSCDNPPKTFTITWKNYDGIKLEVDYGVPYGTLPTYDGHLPIRFDSGQFNYAFSGWSPEVVVVTENTTYTAVFNGKYFLGLYPQTEVIDPSLITTLNDSSGALPTSDNSQSWTSYNFYISSSNATNFMWYQDISVNEDIYRGVYFTSYRPFYIDIASSSDNSYQDDNGYLINTRYWFKFEPISWDLLSVDESSGPLLLSSKVIDSQEYYHSTLERTINEQIVYSNNYKESNIRAWLNNSFLNTAFTTSEQSLIKTTTVDNSANSTDSHSNQYATTNTNDKLFLPSYREVIDANYRFSTRTDSHISRVRSVTDYAKAMGVYAYLGNFSYWWLRSPSHYYAYNALLVYHDGSISQYYRVNRTHYGVVPSFRINQ